MCSKSKSKSKKSGACYLAVFHFIVICIQFLLVRFLYFITLYLVFLQKSGRKCTHFVSLKHEGTTINDILNGEVFRSLRGEGMFLCIPEHTGLILSCDGPWKEGKPLVWDATCRDTAERGLGLVAAEAESQKRKKYSSLAAKYFFIPIACESLGVFGAKTLSLFKDLGHRLHQTTGDSQSYQFLLKRLSVAIQRGNSWEH